MQYRFTSQTDHSHLASGRVLYSAPGFPAFPVRLASEIFQQAHADIGSPTKVALLDPVCGSGYLLTVLGLLHLEKFKLLAGVDMDSGAVQLAKRNLHLLAPGGLLDREKELQAEFVRYPKESYREAVQSAKFLATSSSFDGTTELSVFQADSSDEENIQKILGPRKFDIIFADVPYGESVSWGGKAESCTASTAVSLLVKATLPLISPTGEWVIVTPSKLRIEFPETVSRIRRQRIGHREIYYLKRRDA